MRFLKILYIILDIIISPNWLGTSISPKLYLWHIKMSFCMVSGINVTKTYFLTFIYNLESSSSSNIIHWKNFLLQCCYMLSRSHYEATDNYRFSLFPTINLFQLQTRFHQKISPINFNDEYKWINTSNYRLHVEP